MRLSAWVHARVVAPVLNTDASAAQVAWGTGIGMFIALLPMVGQLYFLPVCWAACRWLLRRTFHLPLAYGMLLLINPPLKLVTFYAYLVTGNALLSAFGWPGIAAGWTEFRAALAVPGSDWVTELMSAGELALRHFGLPILVGGLLWALAGGVLAFALAWGGVLVGRRRRARAAPSLAPQRSSA